MGFLFAIMVVACSFLLGALVALYPFTVSWSPVGRAASRSPVAPGPDR